MMKVDKYMLRGYDVLYVIDPMDCNQGLNSSKDSHFFKLLFTLLKTYKPFDSVEF